MRAHALRMTCVCVRGMCVRPLGARAVQRDLFRHFDFFLRKGYRVCPPTQPKYIVRASAGRFDAIEIQSPEEGRRWCGRLLAVLDMEAQDDESCASYGFVQFFAGAGAEWHEGSPVHEHFPAHFAQWKYNSEYAIVDLGSIVHRLALLDDAGQSHTAIEMVPGAASA